MYIILQFFIVYCLLNYIKKIYLLYSTECPRLNTDEIECNTYTRFKYFLSQKGPFHIRNNVGFTFSVFVYDTKASHLPCYVRTLHIFRFASGMEFELSYNKSALLCPIGCFSPIVIVSTDSLIVPIKPLIFHYVLTIYGNTLLFFLHICRYKFTDKTDLSIKITDKSVIIGDGIFVGLSSVITV